MHVDASRSGAIGRSAVNARTVAVAIGGRARTAIVRRTPRGRSVTIAMSVTIAFVAACIANHESAAGKPSQAGIADTANPGGQVVEVTERAVSPLCDDALSKRRADAGDTLELIARRGVRIDRRPRGSARYQPEPEPEPTPPPSRLHPPSVRRRVCARTAAQDSLLQATSSSSVRFGA
jgi:hypothetical protein